MSIHVICGVIYSKIQGQYEMISVDVAGTNKNWLTHTGIVKKYADLLNFEQNKFNNVVSLCKPVRN